MITISLLDARIGLNRKCRELFDNEKIAKEIYSYLCDGLEECEEVEPERENGRWQVDPSGYGFWICSACGFVSEASGADLLYNFCPNCGADMRERKEE